MGKEEKVQNNGTHLEQREKTFKELKTGNELSTLVFNDIVEEEKKRILDEYKEIYKKAVDKVKSLEDERKKLNAGKKSFEKNEKGEFVEKETFDEQAVQRLNKITEQLKKLNEAIDAAMIIGDYEKWQALNKQLK